MFTRRHAFTLIEMLVVIAIIAMLVSIVMPSLNTARMLAKITKAHVDLRNIIRSLHAYSTDNKEQYPPTRASCSSQVGYELPIELADYLPQGKKNGVDITEMHGPFSVAETYKYRAVGTAILNETTIDEGGANIWIPDGFPGVQADTGKYYNDPATSPVRYAVWSYGPDATAAKFDIPGRLPVPQKYWLSGPNDTGVITHIMLSTDMVITSP